MILGDSPTDKVLLCGRSDVGKRALAVVVEREGAVLLESQIAGEPLLAWLFTDPLDNDAPFEAGGGIRFRRLGHRSVVLEYEAYEVAGWARFAAIDVETEIHLADWLRPDPASV